MGDLNQLSFVKSHQSVLRGPFLEVGSKDYGSTQDLRLLFGHAYVLAPTNVLMIGRKPVSQSRAA